MLFFFWNILCEQTFIIEALDIDLHIKLSGDNMVALGIAHGNNFLKFRILEALMWADEPLTTRDIEKILGVQRATISAAMSRYQKIHKRSGKIITLPYIERLKAKAPNGAYRYKITKKGIEAYVAYLQRIRRGVSLNRVSDEIQHMETYCRYPPRSKLKTRSDYNLLPEQLLPYYSMTQMGKAFDEEHGLDKETHISRMENRIRQLSSESKSA
jgi:predicted transcriptional regulator